VMALAVWLLACGTSGSGAGQDEGVEGYDASASEELHEDLFEGVPLDVVADETVLQDNAQVDIEPPSGAFQQVDLTTSADIASIFASPEAGVFAVGAAGLILRWDGKQFVPVASPTQRELLSISGEGKTLLAVGRGGTVLRRAGLGGFEVLKAPTSADLYGVGVVSSDEFYVVGEAGLLLSHRSDGWHQETTGISVNLYGIHASATGGVFAVGAHGTLVERKGSGWVSSVIAPSDRTLRAIWRSADGRMFVVGSSGTVVATEGGAWKLWSTNDATDPPRDLWAVYGLSASEVYAVGDRGAVFRFNGYKWSLMPVSGPYNTLSDLRAVGGYAVADGPVSLFAAGLKGKGLRFQDKAWSDQPFGVVADLLGVSVAPDGSVVIVGANGLVMRCTSDLRCSALEGSSSARLFAVSWPYVVGEGGTLLRLNGDAVTKIDTGLNSNLTDVWAMTPDSAFAVSDQGDVLSVSNDKAKAISGVPGQRLNAVCAPAGGAVFVAGEGGALYVNLGSGFGQVPTGTASTLWDLWPASLDRVYAVGDNGVVLGCDATLCSVLAEDPSTFLYGLGGFAPDHVLAVGWGGAIFKLFDNKVVALDSGTLRVLKAVAARAKGPAYVVGLTGTLLVERKE